MMGGLSAQILRGEAPRCVTYKDSAMPVLPLQVAGSPRKGHEHHGDPLVPAPLSRALWVAK
jgi:hypothetical protein